jgi:hypothetical protein
MRLLMFAIALTGGPVLAATAARAAGDEFVPLFDGKSFDGWTFTVKPDKDGKKADPRTTWSVADGVIVCTGKPNGYMATVKEYGDYVLKVKWRFPAEGKGGNSGVLLHVQKEDRMWPTCIEAQLLTGRAGDLLMTNPPEAKLEGVESRRDPKLERRFFRIETREPIEKKLGEWNQYEITCRGGDITLAINGVTVNEGKNGNLRKGRIALQSEGAPIQFKDVMIRGLD